MTDIDTGSVTARDVSIVYGRGRKAIVALEGLNVQINGGEFVSIIGPSGCGKSTFLKAVADLVPARCVQGEIRVRGLTPREARMENAFAFVFQDPVLAPWRTVLQNINLPLEIVESSKRNSTQSPEELVNFVGLEGFKDALPAALSGGMRQRVAIARALTLAPEFLLMDEPFGALDEFTRDRMHDDLLRVWGATTAGVLFVTHSIAEAVYLSDRVLVMTSRPGRLRSVIDVDFPRPRTPELKTMVPFLEKTNEVRRALDIFEDQEVG